MPRRRVGVRGYDRTRSGRAERVRSYEREQDVRGDPPAMSPLKRRRSFEMKPVVIGGKAVPKVLLPGDAHWIDGAYSRGFGFPGEPPQLADLYVDTDKVVIEGILFDEDTEFEWQDPDFLSSVDEEFARSGEHPNWVEEYNAGEIDLEAETGLSEFYHFKAGGPMGVGYRITADGEVQIFPKDTALGRIPLYEVRYDTKETHFPYGDEILWRQKGEKQFHGAGGE